MAYITCELHTAQWPAKFKLMDMSEWWVNSIKKQTRVIFGLHTSLYCNGLARVVCL